MKIPILCFVIFLSNAMRDKVLKYAEMRVVFIGFDSWHKHRSNFWQSCQQCTYRYFKNVIKLGNNIIMMINVTT